MKSKQPILLFCKDKELQISMKEACKDSYITHTASCFSEAEKVLSMHLTKAIVACYDTLQDAGEAPFFQLLDKSVVSIPILIALDFSDTNKVLKAIASDRALRYVRINKPNHLLKSLQAAIEESLNADEFDQGLIKQQTRLIQLEKELSTSLNTTRIKSAFIANLSHEIRTPLNAIIGFSQLIQNRELPKKQLTTYHNLIEKGINELFSLLEDITLMAKIDNKELELRERPTDIKEFFTLFYNEIKYNPAYRAKEKVDILVPRFFDQTTSFYTDSRKLKDILHRLVNNAYKFTEEGNIEIGYDISTHEGQKLIHFFVKDTGKGIPKNQLDQIFNRFNKLENQHEMLYKGLGIGLTISQALARIINAKITVESEIKRGSTFMVSIPFRDCDETLIIE